MVEQLIAQPGHEDMIEELIVAVYDLGEISLADPENSIKLRDFDMWARVVVRSPASRHQYAFQASHHCL